MKKSSIYGAGISFFIAMIILATVAIVTNNKNDKNNNLEKSDLKENSNQQHKEVVINNTRPFYTESNVEGENEITEELKDKEEKIDNEQLNSLEDYNNKNLEIEKNIETEKIIEEENVETEKIIEEENVETGVFDIQTPIFKYPINGEIVMDYSIDKAIFDITLEQYRTNDSIAISANEGSDVFASADGKISKIYEDSENGLSIVIEHKNGWQTTYSQLKKDIAVKEGENVKCGQKIGSVSNPTSYRVLLGSHLDFKIEQNGETIDPKVVLVR